MIRLGLERISLLVRDVSYPWRAIHVAGTNGKGSVCAYIAAMLHQGHVKTGRFTSPHLIDRWDCISVAEETISKGAFDEAEASVKRRDAEQDIGASEFELLTATAFEIFSKEEVDVAVIECGMGGRLDATNVITKPLATVITQIGLDHQAILGDTLVKIAGEKAGIIKPDADCFVLGTNTPEVLEAISVIARAQQVGVVVVPPLIDGQQPGNLPSQEGILPLDVHLRNNMNVAWTVIQSLKLPLASISPGSIFSSYSQDSLDKQLMRTLSQTKVPGRSQTVDLQALTGRRQSVFCDGGHNGLGFATLKESIRRRGWRGADGKGAITWLVAITSGRDPAELNKCIEGQDQVVATEFGAVDGMPWISATPAQSVVDGMASSKKFTEEDVSSALSKAVEVADGGPLIITGSLYLLSDIFRLNRSMASYG